MPLPEQKSASTQFSPVSGFREMGLPWRLLIFSFFLFGFSVFVFLGLKFGYGTYLSAQADAIDSDIDALAGVVSSDEQASLVKFYSQLLNTEQVLDEHRFASNVFSFLEANVVSGVYFTNASLDLSGAVSVSAEAIFPEDVTSQLAVFDSSPEVSSVVLGGVNFSVDGTSFTITIFFSDNFFEKIR